MLSWLFARIPKIFLIIMAVHSFVLGYLDVQMCLETAAQSFIVHFFAASLKILPLDVGSSFKIYFSDTQCF